MTPQGCFTGKTWKPFGERPKYLGLSRRQLSQLAVSLLIGRTA